MKKIILDFLEWMDKIVKDHPMTLETDNEDVAEMFLSDYKKEKKISTWGLNRYNRYQRVGSQQNYISVESCARDFPNHYVHILKVDENNQPTKFELRPLSELSGIVYNPGNCEEK